MKKKVPMDGKCDRLLKSIFIKKRDQRGKSKFSRVNITRPEMGKQNIQYMYKLQRSDNKKM